MCQTRIPVFKLPPTLSGKQFQDLVQYPVIVESWDKKNFGKGKRAWEFEFSGREQQIIARWHSDFKQWYLREGIPERIYCSLATVTLLRRACKFFAGV